MTLQSNPADKTVEVLVSAHLPIITSVTTRPAIVSVSRSSIRFDSPVRECTIKADGGFGIKYSTRG